MKWFSRGKNQPPDETLGSAGPDQGPGAGAQQVPPVSGMKPSVDAVTAYHSDRAWQPVDTTDSTPNAPVEMTDPAGSAVPQQLANVTDPQTGGPVGAAQVGALAAMLHEGHPGDSGGGGDQSVEGEQVGDDEPVGVRPAWLVTTSKITGWVLTVVFVCVLVLAWPLAWGGRFSWTVVSGISMEPTFYTGDLTLAYKTNDYEVGDIIVYTVTFDDKTGAIIHRVVEVLPSGGYKTKGDNNDFIDPWVAQPQNIRGEVIQSFSGAAKYVGLLRSPLFWIIPIGLMVTWFFWPSPEEPIPPEDEDVDPEQPEELGAGDLGPPEHLTVTPESNSRPASG